LGCPEAQATGTDANILARPNGTDAFTDDITPTYNLQPQVPTDYARMHSGTLMSQVSMKKGVRMFGDAWIEAILKELWQLHEWKVLAPRSAHNLSANKKQAALHYLMFLKQKPNGTIKDCRCADGQKQQEYITKEDSCSPTVAIESVLISSVLDAMEGHDVAKVDIPCAFMQADMDKVVHMKLEGKMADLLVSLDPSTYGPYMHNAHSKNVLYIELRKALYGTLHAALLFWRCLTAELVGMSCVVNP
jgi:hypothetical protein